MRRPRQRGAAMAEMVLLAPVMITMWIGIDYFRSGYARRLETLAQAHQKAWTLAYSNDGSCFANKEFFAGFTGENDPTDASNTGDKGSEAAQAFTSSTSSSMFMYAHANVSASMALTAGRSDALSGGNVKGGMYITCNEVVPVATSSDKYADQNVLTPLWDFVSNLL